MRLSHRNEKIQALAAYGADESFASGIGFGRPHWSAQDSHSQSSHLLIQVSGENAVAVMNDETIRVAARQCLTELLQGPLGRGMSRHRVVQNLAAI